MDILTKKVFGKVPVFGALFFLVCVFCLIPGHSLIVSAQEVEVRASVDLGEDETVNVEVVGETEDFVIIDQDIMFIELETEESPDDADAFDEGETPSEDGNRESGEESPRENAGDSFEPEVREMMEEEGISEKDLGESPELRAKFREKVEKRREQMKESEAGRGPGRGENRRPGRQGRGGNRGGLERYTSVIVKNNLFLQLGSGGEEKGPEYALTAVVSDTSEESGKSRAIIERMGGGESYYVAEGDTFAGGVQVVDIEDDAVKLDNSGEEISLSLGEGTSGGGGGQRGGGGGGGGRRNAGAGARRPGGGGGGSEDGDPNRGERGGGDFNPDSIPPFARRMMEERGISIEQLRDDPELRQRLRQEFMQRDGGRQMLQGRRGDGGGRRRR